MNIAQFIRSTVYGWYVNMVKAYVRYGEFIRKVLPMRHGYVMMREYFRKVRQRFGCQSPVPNRHEWLIRRENVKLCVWYAYDFRRIRRMRGLVRQPSKRQICLGEQQAYCILKLASRTEFAMYPMLDCGVHNSVCGREIVCSASNNQGSNFRPCVNILKAVPANTRRWPNVQLMLVNRLRRWPNSSPTLAQCLVFAGVSLDSSHHHQELFMAQFSLCPRMT